MKQAKAKIIEAFVIVAFPVALIIGCTSNGEDSTRDAVIKNNSSQLEQIPKAQSGLDRTPHANASDNSLGSGNSNSKVLLHTLENDQQMLIATNFKRPDLPESDQPEMVRIGFKTNQHEVSENHYAVLQQHALYLISHPQQVVGVNGYSDNRGNAKYNFALSQKRAQRVADILKSFGVPKSQIKINAYGAAFPLNDNDDHGENRRVELQYLTRQPEDQHVVRAD